MDVSIVITTYNYSAFIKECIDSCLSQNDTSIKYEVIVVDDGSTDQTPNLLNNITDLRLRKFQIENVGIEAASNFGFKKACGEYVVRVDADDKLYSNYLKDISPYLAKGFDFIYPDYNVINAAGENIDIVSLPNYNPSEIIQRGDFLATGTLYMSKVIEEIGGYSTSIRNCGLENYELILRILKAGGRGKHIPQQLFSYRRHDKSISVLKKEKIIQNGVVLFKEMELGSYSTNKNHPYNLIVG